MIGRGRLMQAGLALGVIVLALGLSWEIEPTSAAEAVDRLSAMLEAEATVSYQGMKEWMRASRGRETTSTLLVSHYGGGPTIVDWVRPRRRSSTQWHHRFYWLCDMDLLLRNYVVEEKGRERIVDRSGVVLQLRSKYPGRPSMRLVVDEETGLLLATDHLDYGGRLVFRSRFKTLLLDAELPSRPERRRGKSSPRGTWRMPENKPELGIQPLLPAYLPEGFVEKWRHPLWWGGLRTVYSDGLTWIELRQTKAREPREDRVVHKKRYGSTVGMRLVVDGVEFRLKGKLDPDILFKILESLEAPRNP